MSEREVIKEEIVKGFFGDIKPAPWYELWFVLKPRWWWNDFSFWVKNKYQQFRYGYSLYDAWDFKSRHAEWCIPRLKHLRDNHIGYPAQMEDESGENIGLDIQTVPPAEGEEGKEHFDKCSKKWEAILDKMTWSFENLDKHPNPIYPDDYDKSQKKTTYDDGSVSYEALDKRKPDYTPLEEHEKRVQEGLDLFAKHYQNLWD